MSTIADFVQVDNIPIALKERNRWLLWAYQGENGKRRKVPLSAITYQATSVKDPASWVPFSTIVATFETSPKPLEGIGFAFSPEDDLIGIDLDHCVDNGLVASWALDIIQRIDSYTEISPSETGVKIFVRGTIPRTRRKEHVEVYDKERFFTVTGAHLAGTPAEIQERSEAVLAFYRATFGEEKPEQLPQSEQAEHADEFPGTDEDIVQHASSAASGSSAAKFKRLWAGKWEDEYDSASEADMALVNLLAWYTSSHERIDRLFRQSKLYREKWDRKNYRATTINTALRDRKYSYEQSIRGARASSSEPPADDPPTEGAADFAPHDPDSEHLTELGNARRFIAQHGHRVRYCVEWGKWLLWDGIRWAVVSPQRIQPLACKTIQSIYQEAAEQETKKARRLYIQWALKSESQGQINAMINLAQMHCLVAPEALDTHPWLLNCENGTIDLRTGALLTPDPSWLLTKKVPLAYHQDASCPLFEEFLDAVMQGQQELVDFLHLALGYSLTGDTREQIFFLLYGSGQNGKSTFLEILDEVLGEYATTADFSTFLHKEFESVRNDIARLRGARFVIAVEADEAKRLGESVLKQMTGGDKITARFLFQENFEFRPVLKLWLAANHKPQIKGTDFAIWRRVRLIPFTRTFTPEERDKTIKERLRTELPGILAWCVRGCQRWLTEGLITPEAVLLATEEYRQEQDVVSTFITDMCTKSDTSSVGATTLFEAFQKWSGNKGMTQTSFGRKLKELGFQKGKDSVTGRVLWRGLFLSTTFD